jgi:hypothetical protein
MIQHRASHVDHDLTEAQLRYLLGHFADRDAFFLETIELPEDLGTVPCALYGPSMGDPPIDETQVSYGRRGARAWPSRLVERAPRQTRRVTVIAGPHEELCPSCHGHELGHSPPCDMCDAGKITHACVLYTAFGGPAAPQEADDPTCKDPATSATFWHEHALASRYGANTR